MGLVNFEIVFDGSNDIYISGQAISGNLKFTLTEEKRMRGVELTFQGEADVFWTEKQHQTSQQYRNNERYLNQSIYLVGGPEDEIVLPPNNYCYPFRYYIPTNIPSSFEGQHGKIRYYIRGVINRPWRIDHKCKRPFTVISPLDLNGQPNIEEPFKMEASKGTWFGLCSKDTLTLAVSLPCRGFVPGQEIKAHVEADNQTRKSADLKYKFIQKVTFISKCGKRKVEEYEVVKQPLGVVFMRGSLTESISFKVPAIPASFLYYCTVIFIEYILQVRGVFSMLMPDARVDVPITIGTIPLRSQFHNLAPPTAFAAATPAPAPPPFELYPEIPPPSYEASVAIKGMLPFVFDSEAKQNAPRYPVYQFK